MTKRFFAALFLTVVLSMSAAATTVSPAAASEKPTPQYSVCKSCGAEAVQKEETRYGKWNYAGEVSCIHEGGGDSYKDEKQVRLVLYPAVCQKCGVSETEVQVEEQFIHIGNPKKIQYVL